ETGPPRSGSLLRVKRTCQRATGRVIRVSIVLEPDTRGRPVPSFRMWAGYRRARQRTRSAFGTGFFGSLIGRRDGPQGLQFGIGKFRHGGLAPLVVVSQAGTRRNEAADDNV